MAVVGRLRKAAWGWGGGLLHRAMPPLPGCAEPVTKFQLTNGRLVLLLGGRARLINELGGDCGQEP